MKTTIMKTSTGYTLTGVYLDALGCEREVEFYFNQRGIRIGGLSANDVIMFPNTWAGFARMMGLPVKARKMKRWLANRSELLAAGTIEIES